MSGAGVDISRSCSHLLRSEDCPDFRYLVAASTPEGQRRCEFLGRLPDFSKLFLGGNPGAQFPPVAVPASAPHVATGRFPTGVRPEEIAPRSDSTLGHAAHAAAGMADEFIGAHTADRPRFSDDWRNVVYGVHTDAELAQIRHLVGYSGPGGKYRPLRMCLLEGESGRSTPTPASALQRALDPTLILADRDLTPEESRAAVLCIRRNAKSDGEREASCLLGNEVEQALFPLLERDDDHQGKSFEKVTKPVDFKYNGSAIARFFIWLLDMICLGRAFDLLGRYKWAHMVKNSEYVTDRTSAFYALAGGPRLSLHHAYGEDIGSCVNNGLKIIVTNAFNLARLRAAVELSYDYDHRQEGLIAMLATTDREAFIEGLYNIIRSRQLQSSGLLSGGIFENNKYVQRKVAEAIYNALIAGVSEVMAKSQVAVATEYSQSFNQHLGQYLGVMTEDTSFATMENRKVQRGGKTLDYFDYLRGLVDSNPVLDDAQRAGLKASITTVESQANAAKKSYERRQQLMPQITPLATRLAEHPLDAGRMVAEIVQFRSQWDTSAENEAGGVLLPSDKARLGLALQDIQVGAANCKEIARLAEDLQSRIDGADSVESAQALVQEANSFAATNIAPKVLNTNEKNYATAGALQTQLVDPLVEKANKQLASLQAMAVRARSVAGLRVPRVVDGDDLQANVRRVTEMVGAMRDEISRDAALLPAHRDALLARLTAKQGELIKDLTGRYLDGIGDISLFYRLPEVREQVAALDSQYRGLDLVSLVTTRAQVSLRLRQMLAEKGGQQLVGDSLGALVSSWPILNRGYQPLRDDWLNLAVDRALLMEEGHRSTDEAVAQRIHAELESQHVKGLPSIDDLTQRVAARKRAGASVACMTENVNRLAGARVYQSNLVQVFESQAEILSADPGRVEAIDREFFGTAERPGQDVVDVAQKHGRQLPPEVGAQIAANFLAMMREVRTVAGLNERVMSHMADRPSLLFPCADLLASYAQKLNAAFPQRGAPVGLPSEKKR